ncbi:MAG: hypothetical protein CYG60_14650 [Actinobacteria bacterium]|nr:MAG: hypothetical protein CYG60_14650 [Actinomycetota bacterium]
MPHRELRVASAGERRAARLEILFDLVFVVAALDGSLREDPPVRFLGCLLLFMRVGRCAYAPRVPR